MSLFGSLPINGEVGLRLLFSPLGANVIARATCVTVGLGFPVYSTFKAIEQKDVEEKERWLVYWTVYGCFGAVEVFIDKFLSWFPYYHHMKLAFLIWLQLPSSSGARHLLVNYLRPFFLKYRANLDCIVDGTRNAIGNFVVSHEKELRLARCAMQKLAIAAYRAAEEFLTSSNERISGSSSSNPDPRVGSSHGRSVQDPGWIDVPSVDSDREVQRPSS